ncbi:RNA polymerase sigma factor [Novosphingobium flavum]|uniref:RNA polymerase sigma factor n=1 Tax=Novosphingobium flavum TaxID=1778672 RepID=A0A7X1KK90_9SPHN|nr:RNA polymerase sigma factor [Novosphingobium flavum]MBC2664033.1 RNA polymerase sigma factor [Novosphingobium flavum]
MPEAGIAAIFLANRAMVRRLLLARGIGADEADEVLQDMWVRIEQSRIGPVADPLSYLMRMATNLATDRRIAGQRRLVREDAWTSLQPVGHEVPDQERRLISASELARLEALLASMPVHMRQALVLFRVEGRSQRAIADILGMSLSGVEKLLARAYRQLVEFRNDHPASLPERRATPGDRSKSNG